MRSHITSMPALLRKEPSQTELVLASDCVQANVSWLQFTCLKGKEKAEADIALSSYSFPIPRRIVAQLLICWVDPTLFR